MRGEDVANPTKPGQKGHDRHGVEPREASPDLRHSPPGQAAAGKPAGVLPSMKRQVPFEREMNVGRTAKERQHTEREAHDKTQKIKISPGHRTPRAHPVRELEFETQTPTNSVLQRRWRRMPAAFLPAASFLARTQNFIQALRQAGRTKNLRQERYRFARFFILGDCQKSPL